MDLAHVSDVVSFFIVASIKDGKDQRTIDVAIDRLRKKLYTKYGFCVLIENEPPPQVPYQVHLRVVADGRAYATLKADVDAWRVLGAKSQTRSAPAPTTLPDMKAFAETSHILEDWNVGPSSAVLPRELERWSHIKSLTALMRNDLKRHLPNAMAAAADDAAPVTRAEMRAALAAQMDELTAFYEAKIAVLMTELQRYRERYGPLDDVHP